MAKANRKTRKELETIIQEIIRELHFLRQSFLTLDNYMGAYIKWKGEELMFNNYISEEVEKAQKAKETKRNNPVNEDIESVKKSRYAKIENPL